MPWPVTPLSRPTSSHRNSTSGISRPSSRSSACSLATPRETLTRDSLADELGSGGGFGDSLANELGGGDWGGEYFGEEEFEGEGYSEYGTEIHGEADSEEVRSHNNGDTMSNHDLSKSFPSYDGSEYGEGLSAELDNAIRAVNHVIRQSLEQAGLGEEGSEESKPVVADIPPELTILPSQAAIEAGVSRLVSTHGALAGHVAHQTRVIASLGSALLNPVAPPVAPEEAAELAGLIRNVLLELPRPTFLAPIPSSSQMSSSGPPLTPPSSSQRHRPSSSGLPSIPDSGIPPIPQSALVTLHNLYVSTGSLLEQLSQLTDSLHVFRQSHNSAAKRLASTRMLVHSIRREMEKSDRAEIYLERGDWDRKLREREVSKECRLVVEGFESAWQGRLAVLEEG